MWISIITRLPIENPPPLLSVFWSVPWPDGEHSEKVVCFDCGEEVGIKEAGSRRVRDLKFSELEGLGIVWNRTLGYLPRELDTRCGCETSGSARIQGKDARAIYTKAPFGKENNWAGARKIVHLGRDVRVFPNEFNTLTDEALSERLEAYELVAEDAPQSALVQYILDSDQKVLYEFALLEGADENTALQVATGSNIDENELSNIQPLGWYKLLPAYQAYF